MITWGYCHIIWSPSLSGTSMLLLVLTEWDSSSLTFASIRGSIKMRMSASRAKMDRAFTASQLNPSLFSAEDFFFMWKKSLLRLYLQTGKLFAPVECIFTTGHCVNRMIMPFRTFSSCKVPSAKENRFTVSFKTSLTKWKCTFSQSGVSSPFPVG